MEQRTIVKAIARQLQQSTEKHHYIVFWLLLLLCLFQKHLLSCCMHKNMNTNEINDLLFFYSWYYFVTDVFTCVKILTKTCFSSFVIKFCQACQLGWGHHPLSAVKLFIHSFYIPSAYGIITWCNKAYGAGGVVWRHHQGAHWQNREIEENLHI